MVERKRVQIKGRVQGVGFRPFIYRLAQKYHLLGWVQNNSEGVLLEVQGEKIQAFLEEITSKKPAAAQIKSMTALSIIPIEASAFVIKESQKKSSCRMEVAPDRKICESCLKELYEPENKRHQDPLINCAQCGPRFTIIRHLPYDRAQSAMANFKCCESCQSEYMNPMNPRFHTESICCPRCEPKLMIWNTVTGGGKNEFSQAGKDEVIQTLREKLKMGKIVAIKGIGGYHLACKIEAPLIKELRKRKKRDLRPLAIMVKDLNVARRYGEITEEEAQLLTSEAAPIVLIKKNPKFELGGLLAPETNQIGIMLPYTAIHYLLLEEELEALIMTSGNTSGEAIYYEDREAHFKLGEIADCILSHERRIEIGIDDSVARVIDGTPQMIRRARGYVPNPISLKKVKEVFELVSINGMSCGGDLKNTFCIVRDEEAYLSQHIGSLESPSGLTFYKQGMKHFKKILEYEPEWVAYDLHPEYVSTRYAKQFKEKTLIGVQHHKAHLASCLTENEVMGPAIGVVYDGTGYGEDGHLWGGEFFVGDLKGFLRVGQLEYTKMLGGGQAVIEPWRMAYSYLMQLEEAGIKEMEERCHLLYKQFGVSILKEGEELLRASWKKDLGGKVSPLIPYTSSMGRLFDAVAALLGKGEMIHYEAEAAIWLEHQVKVLIKESYPYEIYKDQTGKWVIYMERMLEALLAEKDKGESTAVLAGKFHQTVIRMTVEMCEKLREAYGLRSVALSGGVFQNRILLEGCITELQKQGFKVYWQQQVPTNDGGISLGQCAIAWVKVGRR